MKPIGRASGLGGGQRAQHQNAPGNIAALKAEPGQQGRPAAETLSAMIRPRERSAVIAAWALSLLINALCVIVFMLTFHRQDVLPAKTPDAELPAGPVQQVAGSMSSPLAPPPDVRALRQGQDAVQKAPPGDSLPPVSRKKRQEIKFRKELHRVQQDFLQDAPR